MSIFNIYPDRSHSSYSLVLTFLLLKMNNFFIKQQQDVGHFLWNWAILFWKLCWDFFPLLKLIWNTTAAVYEPHPHLLMYESLRLGASREASWKCKAIKRTSWTNSPHWALLKCNRSRRRRERDQRSVVTHHHIIASLHWDGETTFSSRTNAEWGKRVALLGGDAFKVAWV